MSIFFGLLFARRFYCRSALSLSPGRTGGLFPRINAPNIKNCHTEMIDVTVFIYLLISGLTCLPKSTAIIIFAQSSAM